MHKYAPDSDCDIGHWAAVLGGLKMSKKYFTFLWIFLSQTLETNESKCVYIHIAKTDIYDTTNDKSILFRNPLLQNKDYLARLRLLLVFILSTLFCNLISFLQWKLASSQRQKSDNKSMNWNKNRKVVKFAVRFLRIKVVQLV